MGDQTNSVHARYAAVPQAPKRHRGGRARAVVFLVLCAAALTLYLSWVSGWALRSMLKLRCLLQVAMMAIPLQGLLPLPLSVPLASALVDFVALGNVTYIIKANETVNLVGVPSVTTCRCGHSSPAHHCSWQPACCQAPPCTQLI